MHAHASGPSRTIVPTLRYRDVAAAIDWLCNAFDLERHLVVPGEDGAIHYAQLTFGDGMIMLGPVGAQSAFDGLMTQPADTGGAETQICYLFVEDAAAHCARARAAGAEIVLDIEEEGGRGYSCRDPEGHIWNFGTYDPWKRLVGKTGEPDEEERAPPRSGTMGRWVKRTAVAMGVLIVMAATAVIADWAYGVGAWQPWESETQAADGTTDVPARIGREQLARAREAREAAEQRAKEARERLVQERNARETAERAAQETREQLAKMAAEQGGKEGRELRERLAAAERTMAALRNELAAERIAREAADRTTHQMREQLERETSSKEEAERARQAREKASKERAAKEAAGKEAAAKEAAERTAKEAKEHAAREAAERAAKEAAAKDAREKEAKEKASKERAAAARRPAMRRVYSEPQSKSPPLINWFGG
jgi:uncharacterized glyoxalase superfamily protein PhnB